MKKAWYSLIIVGAALIGIVSAQDVRFYGNPWNYGTGYRHASTEAEGRSRGMADLVRSAGAANLMNSEAAKNYEDARRKYLDNRVYGTQKYFENRAINRQARAAERGPRPTQQDLIRFSNSRKPKRITTSELDPLTGAIAWPSLLLKDEYKSERDQLDKIYAQRANNGYVNADQFTAVDNLTKKMLADLKSNISKYPPQLYVTASNFIKSLAYESYFAVG